MVSVAFSFVEAKKDGHHGRMRKSKRVRKIWLRGAGSMQQGHGRSSGQALHQGGNHKAPCLGNFRFVSQAGDRRRYRRQVGARETTRPDCFNLLLEIIFYDLHQRLDFASQKVHKVVTRDHACFGRISSVSAVFALDGLLYPRLPRFEFGYKFDEKRVVTTESRFIDLFSRPSRIFSLAYLTDCLKILSR